MRQKLSTNLIIAVAAILAAATVGIIIAKTGVLAALILPILLIALILGFYIFRQPFLGFLLVIFFLPFERVPTYNFGGTDIKINVLVGLVTLVAWLLALLFNPTRQKVQPNALAIPLILFILALLLSLTQAVDLGRAVSVLIFTLFTMSLGILATNMISSGGALRQAVIILFFSGLLVGLFGLFQFGGDVVGLPKSVTLLKEGYTSRVFGFPRIQAFSMEPLYLANYLLIPLSLLAAYFLAGFQFKAEKVKSLWERLIANPYFIAALLVLLLVNFILTVSRGGYLGLAVAVLVFAVFYFRRIFTWRNVLIVAVLGLVYWGVTFALSQSEARAGREFFGHVSLNDLYEGESVQGRLATFQGALNIYRRDPILGIGLGNYGPAVKYYPTYPPETGWDIVNNQYIELLAETGLFGLITFLSIFIVLIWRSILAIRTAKDPFLQATTIGLLAALCGTLVQYNFFSTLYIIHIWVLVGLLAGVQNLAIKNGKI